MRIVLPFVALAAVAVVVTTGAQAERAVVIPAAAHDVPATAGTQTAVLAGGCFWGVEAVFQRVRGVKSVTAGYAGGTAATATYDAVSTETTKHAEAVRIVFDPRQVSYATLLRVYFSIAHDPTLVDRQGPDSGPSYRSAIFAQTPAQRSVAAAYIAQLNAAKRYPTAIATKIETGAFFPAEAYHQDFFDRNPTHPYIVRFDKPKVAAFRVAFPTLATTG